MNLGNFQFSLKSMSPQSISRSTQYNWAEMENVGDLPNFQNLGVASDEITIEGVFYPKIHGNKSFFRNATMGSSASSEAGGLLNRLVQSFSESQSYASLDDIRNSDLCKIANHLISDNGTILGRFVIASVKETQSYFDENGQPKKIEFSLSLKRSLGSKGSTISSAGSNIVNSMTDLARSYLKW